MVGQVSNARGYIVFTGKDLFVSAARIHVVVGIAADQSGVAGARGYAITGGTQHDISISNAKAYIVTDPPPEPIVNPVDYDLSGGAEQDTDVVIPAGTTEIEFALWGASGGAGQGFSVAGTLITGGGAHVSGKYPVVEGDIVTLRSGRGGKGAASNSQLSGLGGWPDGADGGYDKKHDAYAGGQGGSSQILVNGMLIAKAGGSVGTGGWPLGGSNIPASETFLHADVTTKVQLVSNNFTVAGSSLSDQSGSLYGWGVTNDGPAGAGLFDGRDGRLFMRYYA